MVQKKLYRWGTHTQSSVTKHNKKQADKKPKVKLIKNAFTGVLGNVLSTWTSDIQPFACLPNNFLFGA
jgi:hypothetical protein